MTSVIFKTSNGFANGTRRCALAVLVSLSSVLRLRGRSVGSFLCGVVILASIPYSARAESFTWNLPGDGNWDNAANWSPYFPFPPNPIVGPPDTGDVAIIQTPYRVTLQDDVLALTGLVIANGASVNMNFNELGVVADDHGGVATITGQGSELIVRHTAGNLNAFYVDHLNLANGGELDIEGTVARIIAGLDVDADSLITGRGELLVQSQINGALGSGFNNRGTIRPDINQTIAITGPVGNPVIDLDGSGGNLNSHLDLSNAGAELTVEPELTDAYGGRITMGVESTLTIEYAWTLGGTGDMPARIDFDAGTTGNSAVISGGPLTLGGPLQHATVRGLAGEGDFSVPVEIHPNSNVLVLDGLGIDFNQATTILGGTFNTPSPLLSDGSIDFNGPTNYSGNITINGLARQHGDASVTDISVITADAFDMDGASGGTTWDINDRIEVHAAQIDTGNNTFNGTIDISGPVAAKLLIDVETSTQREWTMAGTMNLSGTPFGFANRVAGSRMIVTGQLNVQQRVDISADTTLSAASTTDIVASAHVLQMSGVTVVESGAAITGAGYLQNAASGDMSLPAGLSTGNVGLSNEGVLRLGDAVGVISVAEFVQSDGATLVVDVGKNTVGTDSDVLTTSSSEAFVDGFVQPNIVNIGGTFQPPQIGDTFTILTAVGGVGGTFDDVLDSNLGGQLFEWTLIHNPNNVQIELADIAGLPGDYNMNGVVDAPDYIIWRKYIGSQTYLAADGDLSGTVDAADYDFWRSRFGNTLGLGSVAAVPEAGTALLLCIGAVPSVAFRLRRVALT